MKRLLLAGAAALTLSIGAASCGSVDPDAAVVNGTHTSVRDLEQTLTLLRKAGVTDLGSANGTLNADAVRVVLSNVIAVNVFRDEFTKRGLQVGAGGAQDASTLSPRIFAVQDVTLWAKLPQDVRDKWDKASAEYITVSQQLSPSDAEVSAFYDANKDKVGDQTLDQVRAQIVSYLQGQAASKLLVTASVKVNPRYGVWDATKGSVEPLGSSSTTVAPDAGTTTTTQ